VKLTRFRGHPNICVQGVHDLIPSSVAASFGRAISRSASLNACSGMRARASARSFGPAAISGLAPSRFPCALRRLRDMDRAPLALPRMIAKQRRSACEFRKKALRRTNSPTRGRAKTTRISYTADSGHMAAGRFESWSGLVGTRFRLHSHIQSDARGVDMKILQAMLRQFC
jgi:hypothetical protein